MTAQYSFEDIISKNHRMRELFARAIHNLSPRLDTRYESRSISMESGDVIVFCSDGFGDCEDKNGNAFGDEQLEEFLRTNADLPAQEIAAELLRVTDGHAADADFTDDRTAVILRLI